MKKYRHGDVLIVSTVSIPKDAKRLKHRTLAEGEVTGHKHVISKGDASLYEENGVLYLSVESETALLTHEEHKEIALPKGDYRIDIQREYSPDGWRKVAD